jgi:hypothetical protein
MAMTYPPVVAAAGILLSCAGTLADPTVLADDSVNEADTAAPADSPKHDPSGAPVIATLRTRDSELTILSEGGSLRYSLVDAAGETKRLTLDQLRAYDPNLFEFVKTAMARGPVAAPHVGHPSAGMFVDARVEPAMRPEASEESGTPINADRKVFGLSPSPVLLRRD